MRKIIVNENEKALIFKNGKYTRCLSAGYAFLFSNEQEDYVQIYEPITSRYISTEALMENEEMAKNCDIVEVADNEIVLWYANGKFIRALTAGYYAFFKTSRENRFQRICMDDPMVTEDVPAAIFAKMPAALYQKFVVSEYEKGLLTYNGKVMGLLDAGIYYFWKNPAVEVRVQVIDTRLRKMDITGQEILTSDKVTLRLSFVLNYKVKDCVRILTEIEDYQQQIYTTVQLALREYVGKYRLDEILESKNEVSEFVLNRLKAKEDQLFISIDDFGIKDIILPGEIRDIMNTVLVAEKQAQANVITRREEVASTRSLLNTAKLMEENPTLYRLKELEYVEKICGNVGSINLNGNGDVLSQLLNLTSAKKN